jgi:hypothetical protein
VLLVLLSCAMPFRLVSRVLLLLGLPPEVLSTLLFLA